MNNDAESVFGSIDYKSLTPPKKSKEEDYDMHGIDWQKTRRFAEDTEHRKKLILWVKWIVPLWLGLVLCVLVLNRLLKFNLSDSVLITLLTTTTVNILGLAYIVLEGLFKPKRGSNKK